MVKYFYWIFPTTRLSSSQPIHHADYAVLAPRKLIGIKALAITGYLTFRHHASCIWDRCSATLQRKLFVYLINKLIPLYFL